MDKFKIQPRELSAHVLDDGTTGRVCVNLDAWPAPIFADVAGVLHREVIHLVGFYRVVYAAGVQHIIACVELAPLDAKNNDWWLVVVADDKGKVKYQATERGADMRLTRAHIPAFQLLHGRSGHQVQPERVSQHKYTDGRVFVVGAKCNRVWIQPRVVSFGTIFSVLWQTTDGQFILQDYTGNDLICENRYTEIWNAVEAHEFLDYPNPYLIPPAPYHMREIQQKYNTAWMRRWYAKMNSAGQIPLVGVAGLSNVFNYPDGTQIFENKVITPDGHVHTPTPLFVYDRKRREWIDSPERAAEIARQLKRQRGGMVVADDDDNGAELLAVGA